MMSVDIHTPYKPSITTNSDIVSGYGDRMRTGGPGWKDEEFGLACIMFQMVMGKMLERGNWMEE